ncbi:MAG: type II toxin-antitoxin system Phd/YefM family antitoxin [Kiritimatiellia bacterium]
MKTTYTITQAQQQFPAMVKESASAGMIPITRHQETVAYVVSKDRMDAIVETMELLSQPETMAQIRAYERGELNFHSVDALDDEG